MRTCFLLLLFFSVAIVVAADTTEETVFRELLPLVKVHGIEINLPFNSYRTADGELEHVREQAARGSVEAYFILGMLSLFGLQSAHELQLGQSQARDEEVAMSYLLLAAGEGHKDALCAMGILRHWGHGEINVNRAAAKSYFRSASDLGHSYGRWLLGRSLFQEASDSTASREVADGRMAEAAALFRAVAEEIPAAAHQLAVMYEYGLIPRDGDAEEAFRKAAELYAKASRRGFVESTYHLALIHLYGRGVPQDYSVAAELFRSVLRERPHAPSMRYLAIINANGFSRPGGIPDYDLALEWYEACAATTGDFADVRQQCAAERKALADVIHASTQNRISNL